MSLKPRQAAAVPKETMRVARAAFPKGNLYLALRDKLGSIFREEDFAELFPKEGQPALPPQEAQEEARGPCAPSCRFETKRCSYRADSCTARNP